jgi:lysophospholipase L1-like esterase
MNVLKPSRSWIGLRWLLAAVVVLAVGALAAAGSPGRALTRSTWRATWTASPLAPSAGYLKLVDGSRDPALTGFHEQTVREIVFTSVGGTAVRLHLTNAFGTHALVIGAVTIAVQRAGAQLRPGTVRAVTFGGRHSVTIAPAKQVISDPVRFAVRPLQRLAISLYVVNAAGRATYHAMADQTNYVAAGSHVGDRGAGAYAKLPTAGAGSPWYYLDEVDVSGRHASAGTVVAFGDSITDLGASRVNANHRWPNLLARRLVDAFGARALGSVDAGIGGNRVLNDSACYGQAALRRFGRDALSVSGVRAVVVLEGINDIGFSQAPDSGCYAPNRGVSAAQIEAGYGQLIRRAHSHGVKIFGCTLTPFKGARRWTPAAEAKRAAVNDWIRTSHAFDGVFDFDAATRDPHAPLYLRPAYDGGDHLHPNDAGLQAMANAINLSLLQ